MNSRFASNLRGKVSRTLEQARSVGPDLSESPHNVDLVKIKKNFKGKTDVISLMNLYSRYGKAVNELFSTGQLEPSDIYLTGRSFKEGLLQSCRDSSSRKVAFGSVVLRMVFDENEMETHPNELTWARFCALCALVLRGTKKAPDMSALLSNVDLKGETELHIYGIPGAGYLPKYYLDEGSNGQAAISFLMCYVLDYSAYCRENGALDGGIQEYISGIADGYISSEGAVQAALRQTPDITSKIQVGYFLSKVFTFGFSSRPSANQATAKNAANALVSLWNSEHGGGAYEYEEEEEEEPDIPQETVASAAHLLHQHRMTDEEALTPHAMPGGVRTAKSVPRKKLGKP